ncbi:hypothetical protein SPRG_00765 [Saprolegnia parasitica CBS 223.65]|uniref:Uncharacterized protein n=1 Tax=Saprolegnia parasitica (strain CBS 223.65) TaxID=695850 RepID=A0A067D6T8_SAPPC|nr:hypothetical protein SPRG_00765 [Saprolegnia parasitica CBS 223.65]KDO34702.1 hypothetical protein SPRG_00765 [Saprolegnia parasitica CBS 223.65]|eukprot:XP_012194372.1 hypothetical protein SPRG_00765 [Saprolegnia parasitica CBS 223.65]
MASYAGILLQSFDTFSAWKAGFLEACPFRAYYSHSNFDDVDAELRAFGHTLVTNGEDERVLAALEAFITQGRPRRANEAHAYLVSAIHPRLHSVVAGTSDPRELWLSLLTKEQPSLLGSLDSLLHPPRVADGVDVFLRGVSNAADAFLSPLLHFKPPCVMLLSTVEMDRFEAYKALVATRLETAFLAHHWRTQVLSDVSSIERMDKAALTQHIKSARPVLQEAKDEPATAARWVGGANETCDYCVKLHSTKTCTNLHRAILSGKVTTGKAPPRRKQYFKLPPDYCCRYCLLSMRVVVDHCTAGCDRLRTDMMSDHVDRHFKPVGDHDWPKLRPSDWDSYLVKTENEYKQARQLYSTLELEPGSMRLEAKPAAPTHHETPTPAPAPIAVPTPARAPIQVPRQAHVPNDVLAHTPIEEAPGSSSKRRRLSFSSDDEDHFQGCVVQ